MTYMSLHCIDLYMSYSQSNMLSQTETMIMGYKHKSKQVLHSNHEALRYLKNVSKNLFSLLPPQRGT